MRNYRNQRPQISCRTCRHSFDVDYFECESLRCAEGCEIAAEQLREERMTSKNEIVESRLECDKSLYVDDCGICELYEKKRSEPCH